MTGRVGAEAAVASPAVLGDVGGQQLVIVAKHFHRRWTEKPVGACARPDHKASLSARAQHPVQHASFELRVTHPVASPSGWCARTAPPRPRQPPQRPRHPVRPRLANPKRWHVGGLGRVDHLFSAAPGGRSVGAISSPFCSASLRGPCRGTKEMINHPV